MHLRLLRAPNALPMEGGVPIIRNGEIIGAIGDVVRPGRTGRRGGDSRPLDQRSGCGEAMSLLPTER